jgi:endonuclease YncB( thermonuclease family)
MFIPCPKCKKPNEESALYCKRCGFWFNEQPAPAPASAQDLSPPVNEEPKKLNLPPLNEQLNRDAEVPKRNAEKSLLPAGLLVLGCVFLIILIGLKYFGQSSPVAQDETTSFADTNLPALQNTQINNSVIDVPVEGRVIDVVAGDTITVLDGNNQEYRIRLAGIEAPEPKHDFGQKAKENLSTLVLGKTVQVNIQKTDDEGITTGRVLLDVKDINLEQVKAGLARYDRDDAAEQTKHVSQLYADAETTAKKTGLGLWSSGKHKSEPNLQLKAKTKASEAREEKQNAKTFSNVALASSHSNSLPSNVARPTPQTQTQTVANKQSKSPVTSAASPIKTNPTTGRAYTRGPRGGCYYLNSNGNRTYVDKSFCN